MLKKFSFAVAVVMVVTMLFASLPAFAAEETFKCVRFTAQGNDPYASFTFSSAGKNDRINPDTVTWAAIRYKTGSQYDSTGVEYTAQFYINPAAEPCVPIRYNFTGNWETAIIDLTSVSESTELDSIWNSDSYTAVKSIRFDPLEPDRDSEDTSQDTARGQVNSGDYIDVAWIAFFEKEDDAKAYTGKEDTPYCLLDVDSMMELNGANNLDAALYDSNGNPVKSDDPVGKPVKYTVSPRQLDPSTFTGHESVAIEFTVPEGKSFKSFIICAAPTWGAQENANLDAAIYAWNNDYDTTISGKELGTFREELHVDNMDMTMDFGVILPPGRYVIYMTAEDDSIGGWGGNLDEINFDAVYYTDDEENDMWFPYSAIMLIDGTEAAIELPTFAPTAEPTEKPTAAPTEVPTEVPATDAPVATDAPAQPTADNSGKDNTDNTKKDDAKNNKWLLPVVIGAVVVAAAVCGIVIATAKKKKK
ncbi:MAG: PT domain-containing protein [Clostridia bacterium]|nr:PT domain-containing protein [Clostridia bacterium]MBQ3868398.1 PT domain-containing protein [Clostridia bacterium]